MDQQKNITIEEVTSYSPEVANEIRMLVSQLGGGHQKLTEDDAQYMLTSENTHVYIARDEATRAVLGMYTLIVYRIPYKMKAQFEDFVVHQSTRGRGIGKKLLEHAIKEARKYKVKSLNLTSRPERESANTIYQNLGFEKRDTNVYRLEL